MHAIIATVHAIIHQLLWLIAFFTIGIAVTHGSTISSANIVDGYSYISARDGDSSGVTLACCLTGLGPSGNNNGVLGGVYYSGNRIPNSGEQGPCASDVIQVRPGSNNAGVIKIHQCGAFSTAVEGIYTCAMMNSSLMYQSVRFGVYFSGRSESLDLYIPYHSSSLHSCSDDRCFIIIYCNSYDWFFPCIILYLTRVSPRYFHMDKVW